jgi:hypothetical protein
LNLAVINPQTTNILLNKQGARRFSVAPMMDRND